MKYTYVILCHDISRNGQEIAQPYLSDDDLVLFDTFNAAYRAAQDAANEEAEELNESRDNNTRFNVVRNKNSLTVQCCYDNKFTTWITKYEIKSVREVT